MTRPHIFQWGSLSARFGEVSIDDALLNKVSPETTKMTPIFFFGCEKNDPNEGTITWDRPNSREVGRKIIDSKVISDGICERSQVVGPV